MYYFGRGLPQNYGEALRWCRKAAEQDYATAEVNLGLMYDYGKGVPEDHAEAVSWYRKAAKQGDMRAESALGYAYYSSQGVPKDYARAARWYRKAAERGSASAQGWLAFMYEKGQGVQQDDTQAVAWYRKAAGQGDAVAERSLGYMYASGRGVPQDRREAIRWYRKASDQGDAEAKSLLESLGSPPRPPATIRYIELFTALLCLFGGPLLLWSSLGPLLRERRVRDRRQAAGVLLGVDFLACSGLSLYGFARDLCYSPYGRAVLLAGIVLGGAALLLLFPLLAPAKRKPNKTEA